ncbi:BON domain-containing protein [Deinococcus sp. S9]|nr:BON domain-containing protein [Deinococcus sp. S9]
MDSGRGGSSGRDWGWGSQGYSNSDADRWDSGRSNPGYGAGQGYSNEGREGMYGGQYGGYGRSGRSDGGGMSGQGYNASGWSSGQDYGQSGQYGGSGRDQGMFGSQGYSSQGQGGMSGRPSYGQGMYGGQGYGQSQYGSGMGSGPSYRGKGPKGYQRSDDRIKEEVNEALEDEHGVDASDIEVQVQNGEVTLTGTVSDRNQKRLAEDCVERVRGVKDVHNQLRVQPPGRMSMDAMSGSGTSTATSGSTDNTQSKR